MKFLFNKRWLPFVFFASLSGFLVFSWFRFGFIYGGGDVGLPTYNPNRIFGITKFVWWEAVAPGFPVPHGVTSMPLEFFLLILQYLGFSPVALQASLYFVLLFFMGLGMYLLGLTVFGKDKSIWAAVAAIFYLFNPYMMVQVWHRFVHGTFFLAAVLPFFFIFFRSWVQTGKYISLFLFLLTNFLAVYLYGTIAFIVTVWIFLSVVTIFEIFFPWQNIRLALNLSLRFIVGLLFWFLVGSWWLIPTFGVGSSLFAEQHSNDSSLITLMEISRQAALPYSLQMINPYYLFEQAELGDSYKSLLIRLIPWLFVSVILLGILQALRDKRLSFFSLFFLIAIFLSKGAASPFGHSFIWAFTNLFFIGVLRNPFEKLGIFLPFTGSILFALGLMVIYKFLSKFLNRLFAKIVILTFLIMVIGFAWPMISGRIFGRIDNPPFIKIPESYQQADKWLNSQNKAGNILHLPLTRNEGQTYKWEHGYSGVEPSQLLFTSNPSISRGFNIHRVDDSLTALSLIFHKPYPQNKDKILNLLQGFNTRFIILHKDIEWRGTDVYNPIETEKVLDSLDFLERKVVFGDLVIYQLKDDLYQPKIIFTSNIDFAYPPQAAMKTLPWLASSKTSILTVPTQTIDIDVSRLSNNLLIFPKKVQFYKEASTSGIQDVIDGLTIFPYSLTSSPLYSLWIRSQLFAETFEIQKAELNRSIILAGEILVRIFQSQEANPVQIVSLIDSYSQLIDQIFKSNFNQSPLRFDVTDWQFSEIFQAHLILLDRIRYVQNQIMKEKFEGLISKIENSLRQQSLLPNYFQSERNDITGKRVTYVINIPKGGKYEILMANPPAEAAYQNNLKRLIWKINSESKRLNSEIKGEFISFGELEFDKGDYELSPQIPLSSILLSPLKDIKFANDINIIHDQTIQLTALGNFAFFENEINNVGGGDILQFTFEANIEQGSRFIIQLVQDTDHQDITNSQVKIPRVSFSLTKTSLNSNWQKYTLTFPALGITTQKAFIRIVVEPSQQPVANFVTLRNLKIERILNNDILLISKNKEFVDSQPEDKVSFDRINPTLYKGKVKITKNGFFIFKETFHSDWKLTLFKNNEFYHPDKHLLSNLYGNAWYIEKQGEYDFKLEFTSQQKVTLGIYLAIAGWVVIVGLIIKSRLRKKSLK